MADIQKLRWWEFFWNSVKLPGTILALILGALGTLTWIRDEFFSQPSNYRIYSLFQYLPQLKWETYVVVVIVGLFVLFCFASYRQYENLEKKYFGARQLLDEKQIQKENNVKRLTEIIQEAEEIEKDYTFLNQQFPNSVLAKQPLMAISGDLGMGGTPEEAVKWSIRMRRHIENVYAFITLWVNNPSYLEMFPLLPWATLPELFTDEDRIKIRNMDSYIKNNGLNIHIQHLKDLMRKIKGVP